MNKFVPAFLLLCFAGWGAFAQNDFTSLKEQQIIAKRHIKQIKCYWVKDAAKPRDSALVSIWTFDKNGRCIKHASGDATTLYHYNPKGNLSSQTIQQPGKQAMVIIYQYDEKGHMERSTRIKGEPDAAAPFGDYNVHKFRYDEANNLIREYWVNPIGQIHQEYRCEYITKNKDTSLLKVVNFYDEDNKLSFIKRYYKNHQVKDLSVDRGKTTFVAESVLNDNFDLLKFTDYHHPEENTMHQIQKDGHGIIKRDTLTEQYRYTSYGFCAQKLTYKHGKLAESLNWYFKQ